MYNRVMEEQIILGNVVITTENYYLKTNKIHYLHHAVVNQSPSCIHYSAKCNKKHPSLIYYLITGPHMLNELASIPLRFPLNSVTCSADIAKVSSSLD